MEHSWLLLAEGLTAKLLRRRRRVKGTPVDLMPSRQRAGMGFGGLIIELSARVGVITPFSRTDPFDYFL